MSLGRIRAKLGELGLAENTILIFTGDNGGMSASNQYRGVHHPREVLDRRFASSNLPLREPRGGTTRGVSAYPDRALAWSSQGREALLRPWSLAQTLPHSAGDDRSPTASPSAFGWAELRASPARASPDRGALFWHFPHYSNHGYQSPGGAIRLGDYKLLEYYENETVQLFNLKTDLGEQQDLSGLQPAMVEQLRSRLHAWRREVDAKMPCRSRDHESFDGVEQGSLMTLILKPITLASLR